MKADRVRTGAGFAAVLCAVLLSGCTTAGGEPQPPGEPAARATVAVARQDLVSTVSLDAATAATPRFVLLAPASGSFQPAEIDAGEQLARSKAVGSIGSNAVTTPVAAVFESFLVDPGTRVQKNVPVAVLRLGGFALTARVPGPLAYRFYTTPGTGRALIHSGPGPFDCVVLHGIPEQTSGEVRPGAPDGPPVLCAIPDEVEAFTGLTGLLSLRTGRAEQALVVPVSAVTGQAATGQVLLIRSDGSTATVDVKIGMTDGIVVQILEGLKEGDIVSLVAPVVR